MNTYYVLYFPALLIMEETVCRFLIYTAVTWRHVGSKRKISSDPFIDPLPVLFTHRRMVKLNSFLHSLLLVFYFSVLTEYVEGKANRQLRFWKILLHSIPQNKKKLNINPELLLKIFTSHTFQNTYITWHFILPYGVASLSYNEATQTTLLELGFHHSQNTLYQHIPPNGSVLLKSGQSTKK